MSKASVLVLFSELVCFLAIWNWLELAQGCTQNSSLVGFTGEFSMVQHQLRGYIFILDDCSFRVTNFDMISGRDVSWWGAQGEDFLNLTRGHPISSMPLNQTYANATFLVTLENTTWDQIAVLSVWDRATGSDFGHILLDPELYPNENLSPSPSPSPSSSKGMKIGHKQPTMFENCLSLTPSYRLRWTVNWENNSVDLGLEAIISETRYMAFGWAKPGSTQFLMLNSDVVVAGFTGHQDAFVDDYYINKYRECNGDRSKPTGVCPDYLFGSANNNSQLIYGHHMDGVAFIRYNRPLPGIDALIDVPLNATSSMTVIWAMGPLKPPDTLHPFPLPQNHGGPGKVNFGHLPLTLAASIDDCAGPLIASNEEAVDMVTADRGTFLVVDVDTALHYPNPPNPDEVIYINKKEAPILKVERGVPVSFQIQGGHNMAFYITSDPVGGGADNNTNETVFAGGPDAHGVPADPYTLNWLPDRNTPNEVYYQAYYQKKMGWKIEVVDGGLSDMYNSSVYLGEQQVTLFWTLTGSNISFAVRGERKSGYLAIAFGRGMVNSFAYVGWVGNDGTGHINTYWIDGRDAESVHPTSEVLWDKKCRSENGIITFEFSRSLQPACAGNDNSCKNVIDLTLPLKVIWAMGAKWDSDFLSDRNMHDRTSRKATIVNLQRGAAEADQELQPVLVVHGFMMFLAWGILFPGGILAARYLKHLEKGIWFQIHTYLQYSGTAVMLLALLFAAAELRGLHTETFHVKLGIVSILLACWQPLNAYFRPHKPSPAEEPTKARVIWEYLHIYSGRVAVLFGFVTLVAGMSLLADIYGAGQLRGYQWALFAWFLLLVATVVYVELQRYWENGKKNRDDRVQILDSDNEDDSAGLLSTGQGQERLPVSRGTEVQLEALH